MRRPFFVANWKMNQRLADVTRFAELFPALVRGVQADLAIAPQAVHLAALTQALVGSGVAAAGQNCGQAASGAYTGETSPVALKELGAQWVILGHSERRWVFKEDETLVSARLQAAFQAGLRVILCVGERLQERKQGQTFAVLEAQLATLEGLTPAELSNICLAYEPVWAIGTGETATPAQAQEAHRFIRQWTQDHFSTQAAQTVRILYGGSAKADNAEALMKQSEVDGLLVGGASLDPNGFAELVNNGLRSLA